MFWEPSQWKVVKLPNDGERYCIQTGTLPVQDANGAYIDKKIIWRDGKDGMEGKKIYFVDSEPARAKAKADEFLANLVKSLTSAPPPPPEPKPEPKPAPAKKSPGRPKKSDG